VNYLGIDPGESGGFALLNPKGNCIAFHGMQNSLEERLEWLKANIADRNANLRDESGETVVFIEKVSGFQGVQHPGSYMFTFGFNTGFLYGCCLTLGCNVVEVQPKTWQKEFDVVRPNGVSDMKWKTMLLRKAEEIFPQLYITKQTSDALLIARYGYQFTQRCQVASEETSHA
jgi:hypothetical protein